jgi:hypothetical protein
VQYVVSLLFPSLCYFLNAELNPICHLLALLGAHHILHVRRIRVDILFMFCLLYMCFSYFVYSVLCFFCTFSPSVYSCPFPNFVQVYRTLPPGGNPVVVNKYRIITYVLCCLIGYLDRCWLPVLLQSLLFDTSL